MPRNSKLVMPVESSSLRVSCFTAIPNHFLDQIAPILSPSELRVMIYIYRHTLGFHKRTDRMSYDQFINGIVTHDQRRLDAGAGVSRGSLVAALAGLEKKNLIKRLHPGNAGTATVIMLAAAAVSDHSEQEDTSKITTSRLNLPKSAEANPDQPEDMELEKVLPETESGSDSEPSRKYRIKEVQNLDQSNLVRDDEEEVQFLVEKTYLPVQNLDLTKETNSNQNKHDRGAARNNINFIAQLITDRVAGITLSKAVKLVEVAFNHGRDEAYIRSLVEHVTESSAVRVPAALLTALIKGNEDRAPFSPSIKIPAKSSNLSPGEKVFTATASQTRSLHPFLSTSKNRTAHKGKIDFGKYAGCCEVAAKPVAESARPDTSADLTGAEHPILEVNLPAGSGSARGEIPIDFRLKYSLQDYDPKLATYLRRLEVDDRTLTVGFWGIRNTPELANWLPAVNIYYPEVTTIKIIG